MHLFRRVRKISLQNRSINKSRRVNLCLLCVLYIVLYFMAYILYIVLYFMEYIFRNKLALKLNNKLMKLTLNDQIYSFSSHLLITKYFYSSRYYYYYYYYYYYNNLFKQCLGVMMIVIPRFTVQCYISVKDI